MFVVAATCALDAYVTLIADNLAFGEIGNLVAAVSAATGEIRPYGAIVVEFNLLIIAIRF